MHIPTTEAERIPHYDSEQRTRDGQRWRTGGHTAEPVLVVQRRNYMGTYPSGHVHSVPESINILLVAQRRLVDLIGEAVLSRNKHGNATVSRRCPSRTSQRDLPSEPKVCRE